MENFLKGRLNVNIDTFVAQMKTWVLILTGVFFLHTALVAQENSSSAGFFNLQVF